MKKLAYVLLFLFPIFCLAQAAPDTAPISDLDMLQGIMVELTSRKLVGPGLAVSAIQALMLFLRSDMSYKLFGKLGSKERLSVLLALSYAGGVTALVYSGLSVPAALLHSTSFTALQVFAHQIYTVYLEKKQKQ